jgi:RNA polymerase sigma-70 factor (ECF subfamily)
MPSHPEHELEIRDVTEEDTVRQAQVGNPAAFEQLYRRHSGRVYSLCFLFVKNSSEAEDLTQEAFLQVFRKIHTFRGEAKFSTWLQRLTINLVLMRLRKKRHPEVSLDAKPEFAEEYSRPLRELGGPDLQLTGLVDHMNLSRAIERLPDGYKEMFVLHDIEGYEHREIAEILGCSIGNSKSQLHMARLRLRELLKEAIRSRGRNVNESTDRLFRNIKTADFSAPIKLRDREDAADWKEPAAWGEGAMRRTRRFWMLLHTKPIGHPNSFANAKAPMPRRGNRYSRRKFQVKFVVSEIAKQK